MPYLNNEIKKICRDNFKKKNITFYLGAGVSVDNNLPSWEKLILAMYFSTISKQEMNGWRPYSNYLYAIAEWYLKNSSEPLEIIARKIQKYFVDQDHSEFIDLLHTTLYGSMIDDYNVPYPFINGDYIRYENQTLKAIAELCELPHRGINSVITYNYDNLLEIALKGFLHKSIYAANQSYEEELPIFHVHGYVPLDNYTDSSHGSEIIFTEDQYHQISNNAYNWSNLIQVQKMSNSVGIMVGLSLSDRNMRRLLDAVRNSPINNRNYALLQIPDQSPPKEDVLDDIHERAKELLDKFRRSGIKSEQMEGGSIFFSHPGIKSDYPGIKSSRMGTNDPIYQQEISGIIEQVKILERGQQEFVLGQLGIEPIWFEKFEHIPAILSEMFLD
ncbi:MAG: SIR2 family protein [Mariniphaga sp.]|nr:SIR2 family protein [Mariniphaga sp.]